MTKSELAAILEDCGVQCRDGPEDSLIGICPSDDAPIVVVVQASSDGRIVQFRTIKLVMVPSSKVRKALVTALAESNYKYKLGKFAFDPKDGEVSIHIDVVVADNVLTRTQVNRCVRFIRRIGGATRKRFEQLAASGVDPGEISPTPGLHDLLDLLGSRGRSEGRDGTSSSGDGKKPQAQEKPHVSGSDSGSHFDNLLDDILRRGEDDDKPN